MERIPVGNGPYGFFLWLVIKRRWTGGLGRTMGQKMGGIFKKRADYIMSPLRGFGCRVRMMRLQ